MFIRSIEKQLLEWKESPYRKPLIIRGARQVGKTTTVNQFSKYFSQYIYLNLEVPEDKNLFLQDTGIENLVQSIFLSRNKSLSILPTLIFIDEIQAVPEAITALRYFYEQYPQLHIIAAGSLLENILGKSISYPVGRVEYLVLRPASFLEYLIASGENQLAEHYQSSPIPEYAIPLLFKQYHIYTLIGGMPSVVARYAETKDLTALPTIYDSLLQTYISDVEKYSPNTGMLNIMRHIISTVFLEAGKRIKFNGFGNSNYRSREVGEAMRTLERVMLIILNYPITHCTLPAIPDLKKSPRLHVLDTGLMNHFCGLTMGLIGTQDLTDAYKGIVLEHITGQEILAHEFGVLNKLMFWARDKDQSNAETDYIINYNGLLVPVECKSGATGSLRSLHQYMDSAPHDIAIKLYAGPVRVDEVTTANGKTFRLISLPYFLAGRLKESISAYL